MVWVTVFGTLALGMFFSAFFSGTETGLYRVSRVRLVLDGIDGDPIARGLVWLTNNPTLFVATALIGNNLANWVTSLGIVLGTRELLTKGESYTQLAELAVPIVLAPIIFVYGELLPKYLFFQAPNRLLRRSGLLFLGCGVLFAPAAAALWALGRVLQWIVGQSPARVRLVLARKELVGVFEEGHDAGILRPEQRNLAQGLFTVAGRPVTRYHTPAARVVSVRLGAPKKEVYRLANRQRVAAMPVEEIKDRKRVFVGYVRVIDLHLDEGDKVTVVRPLIEVHATDTHLSALMKMRAADESLAKVVDERGTTTGLVATQQLIDPMFRVA